MYDPLFQFFAYEHLPAHLQAGSKPFADFVRTVIETLPRNPARAVAIQKLLEAKDAAVRAILSKPLAVDVSRHDEPIDDAIERAAMEARARGEFL